MAPARYLMPASSGAGARLSPRDHDFRSRPPRRSPVALLVLVAVIAAACAAKGPGDFGDIRVIVDNAGPNTVTVAATSSGPGITGNGDTTVEVGSRAELILRLAERWEVKLDGKRILGSGDRADLALPSAGERRDLVIEIKIAPDGTTTLSGAHYVAPGRSPESG